MKSEIRMVKNHIFITLLLYLVSTAVNAAPWQDPDKIPRNTVEGVAEESREQTEPQSESNLEPSIEEQERQKIITELSYRLETKLSCKQKLTWSDKGSGADLDGFFFTPSIEASYYMIGGYASRKGGANSKRCVMLVRPSENNPAGSPELLVPPRDWSLIWMDKGSGADEDGSFWHGVPPNKEYKCLGSVIQKGYKKPVFPNYRCVHSGLSREIKNKSIVWSDKGSGADKDVTVFKLPNSKSFFAVGKKTNQVKTYDLNDTASIKPDTELVEKRLAERMEQINQNQEPENN